MAQWPPKKAFNSRHDVPSAIEVLGDVASLLSEFWSEATKALALRPNLSSKQFNLLFTFLL